MTEKLVAVVTGAGSGIGYACALRFASDGYQVYVIDRDEEKASKSIDMIRQHGNEAVSLVANVSRSEQVNAVIQSILQKEGRIDVLVNNAGIVLQKLTECLTDGEWMEIINVNLSSVFFASRAVLPTMRRQRSGRIINISSLLSTVPRPLNGPYATSKGGMNSFTSALALEVGRDGITVNAVAPGHILTPLTEPMFTPEVTNAFEARIPMGCLGRPEWVADAVAFLASQRASYITGQVIFVDGGYNINGDLPNLEFGGKSDG